MGNKELEGVAPASQAPGHRPSGVEPASAVSSKAGTPNAWQPIETAPEGVMVKTKIDDEHGVRNEQSLIRRGRLWWAGDMYVYYTPTHWSPGHGQ